MGRYRKNKEVEVHQSNSLVASAALVRGSKVNNLSRSGRDDAWQRQIWEFYHTIGEFRYACDWVGAQLSKAVMFAKLTTNGKQEVLTAGAAFEAIEELYGDSEDRAEMLRLLGIHFTAVGECFLIAYDSTDDDTSRAMWQIVASTEFRYNNDKYYLNNEELPVEDHDGVIAIRMWRPDPVRPKDALSPSRAVMSILGEIARLTDHVAAQVDSRLAGAGILLMPSEMTFPTPPETESETADGEKVAIKRQANDAESLMEVLQETMATAIDDRSDASALVPIVITAPADAISAVKHMTFWTELDEHAIELRSEAIRRLALGMDMPPEVLQGNADSNHWAAWQADEAAIKSHTEPLLKIITTSLAVGYLRPRLRSLAESMIEGDIDYDMIDHYAIGVDTSEMRLRPNRSKEALELYNLGVLSEVALRRETGFSEEDAMTETERGVWFLRKVASGSTTPELVEAALNALKVPIGHVARDEEVDEVQEARPTPTLRDHPVRDLPDREISERRKEIRDTPEGLIASGDQLVLRALERAGNRLKNKFQLDKDTAAVDLYQVAPTEVVKSNNLLTDAWTGVDRIAKRYSLDTEKLSVFLNDYCKITLQSQTAHDYGKFSAIISKAYAEGMLAKETA